MDRLWNPAVIDASLDSRVVLVDIEGPGVIRHVWMTFLPARPERMRALYLEVFYDGAADPSISVPCVDFFGLPHGRPVAYHSALTAVNEGRGLISYVPMPFRRRARVELVNGSASACAAVLPDRLHARTQPAAGPRLPARRFPPGESDRTKARLRHCRWTRRPRPVSGLQRRRAHWHLLDPVMFASDLTVTIQQIGAMFIRVGEEAALAAYERTNPPAGEGWIRDVGPGMLAWGIAERVDDFCATSYVYCRDPQAVPRLDVAED